MNSKAHLYLTASCVCCVAAMVLVVLGCRHESSEYSNNSEPIGVAINKLDKRLEEFDQDRQALVALANEQKALLAEYTELQRAQQDRDRLRDRLLASASVPRSQQIEAIQPFDYSPPFDDFTQALAMNASAPMTLSRGAVDVPLARLTVNDVPIPGFPQRIPSSDDAAIANLNLDEPEVAGAIGEPGETDWFRFALDKPAVVEIDVDSVGSDFDAVLALFGPDAIDEHVAANDDRDGSDPFIQTVVAAGTYYVAVGGYHEQTGEYQLKTRTTAITAVPVGVRDQSGQLSPDRPTVWYQLKTQNAGFFKLAASWQEENVDATLEVTLTEAAPDYSPAPTMFGPAGYENTRLYALAEGEYYLVVSAADLEEPHSFTLDFVELKEAAAP